MLKRCQRPQFRPTKLTKLRRAAPFYSLSQTTPIWATIKKALHNQRTKTMHNRKTVKLITRSKIRNRRISNKAEGGKRFNEIVKPGELPFGSFRAFYYKTRLSSLFRKANKRKGRENKEYDKSMTLFK